MQFDERCVAAHVDIGMRDGLEFADAALGAWTTGADESSGVLDLLALKDQRRPNHFEVVGRFASADAYHAHQLAPSTLAFRRTIGPVLGSPYEDRVLAPRGANNWPTSTVGDFVVITQLEARSDRPDEAVARLDALVSERVGATGLIGLVVLRRPHLLTNHEVLSVWTDAEAFDAHLAMDSVAAATSALEEALLAPIENRRFYVLATGRPA